MGTYLEFKQFAMWMPTQRNVQWRPGKTILRVYLSAIGSLWYGHACLQLDKRKLWVPGRNHNGLRWKLGMRVPRLRPIMEWIRMPLTAMTPPNQTVLFERSISYNSIITSTRMTSPISDKLLRSNSFIELNDQWVSSIKATVASSFISARI